MNHSNYLPWNTHSFTHQPDKVIVIGAGIAGACTTYALSQRGIEVTLIDAAKGPATGASGNPVGLMMPVMTTAPSPLSGYYIQAFEYAIKQAKQLSKSHSFDFNPSGIIQLAFNPRQCDRQAKWLETEAFNHLVSPLTQKEIEISSGLEFPSEGVLFKDGAWLCPVEFVKAHINAAKAPVKTLFQESVASLKYTEGSWHLFDKNKQPIAKSSVVVLANAYGVKQFLPDLPMTLRTVRGQLSRLDNHPITKALKLPISYDGYIVPAQSGTQWLGASFSNKKTKSCLEEDRRHNITQLQSSLPSFELDEKDIENIDQDRAEFRCITSDYLPLVGPVPCQNFYQEAYHELKQVRRLSAYPDAQYLPGLYMNSAHGSRGMISAPFAAELLAREICGESLGISVQCREHIHPARFLIRQLKKGLI